MDIQKTDPYIKKEIKNSRQIQKKTLCYVYSQLLCIYE